MKNTIKVLAFAIIVMMSACQKTEIQTLDPSPAGSGDELAKAGDIIEGHYIVTFKDNQMPMQMLKTEIGYDAKTALATKEVLKLQESILGETTAIDHAYYTGIYGFAGELDDEMVAKLEADPRVARVEPDRYFALNQGKGKPGGGGGNGGSSPPAQTTPWGIAQINGGVSPTNSGKAWIIDTGIDFDHPDLNVNASLSKSFIKNGDGDDDNGHGTHVAGIVGAKDNSIGVIGVAAGAQVISVQVLNRRGLGTLSDIVSGVQYVGQNANSNDVANMSLGGDTSLTLDRAVEAAAQTCPFVLAAGNDGLDANDYSPARTGLNNSDIFTITGYTEPGIYFGTYIPPIVRNDFNRGTAVDYAQPGYSIYSCYKNGDYATLNGTSMAAPHMAGLILIGYTTSSDSVAYYDGYPVETLEKAYLFPYHQ